MSKELIQRIEAWHADRYLREFDSNVCSRQLYHLFYDEWGAHSLILHMEFEILGKLFFMGIGNLWKLNTPPEQYENVVEEVQEFLGRRVEAALSSGIRKEALVIDPGIGFGKTVEHNLDLIAGLGNLLVYGRPVLVGVSRKSFLGSVTGRNQEERLAAGVAVNVLAALYGAAILRVHDVKETCDALKILDMVSRRQA